VQKEFVISGIYNDIGNMKAKGVPGIFMSMQGAEETAAGKSDFYLVEFKDKVNIIKAEKDIMSTLHIAADRIGHNDHLLTLMGQSTSGGARGLYNVGYILFCMVLIAGVIMIYNTFNISVMERVRQFGLLRCIGASRSQIKTLVKRESLAITLKAIPLVLLAGMLLTLICSALLKYYIVTFSGKFPCLPLVKSGLEQVLPSVF
jgi:putative ABC transport system permease protein